MSEQPLTSHSFSTKSKEKLATVDKELQRLFNAAITNSPYDFGITEGIRSPARQQQLYDEGKSQTLNSRHIVGKAVDVVIYVDGKVTWDFDKYKVLADHIKKVSVALNVPIVWGGDWESFRDGVHFQLDGNIYK